MRMDDAELMRQLRELAGGQKALAERLHVAASTLRRWERVGIPAWHRPRVVNLTRQLQQAQQPAADDLDLMLAHGRQEILAAFDRLADGIKDMVRADRP